MQHLDSIRRPLPAAKLPQRTVHQITVEPIALTKAPSKKWQNTKTIISLLIACIVVAGNAMLFTTLQTNNMYTVRSGSMEPTIHTGSIILVQRAHAAPYNTGDVITFRGLTQNVTHRIVEVVETDGAFSYRTKGDANTNTDMHLMPHDRVIGKTSTSVPLLGYILVWLRTKIGFATLILLPATIVILQELRAMRRAWQDIRPQFSLRLATSSLAILITIMASASATFAAFTSTATLSNNQFGTAATFPTPSTSPEPTPSGSPTPSPTPDGGDECETDVDIDQSNTNTGPGSTNENSVDVDINCSKEEANTTTIENEITIDANTGGNEQTNNTAGGGIATGNVGFDIEITNIVEN